MKIHRSIRHFCQTFLHPRVFFFILAGAVVIFLTFFTKNNALEITISGVASVFIGIGVNNFSAFETHLKDEQQIKSKIAHAIRLMGLVHDKVKQANSDITANDFDRLRHQLTEVEQLIQLCIQLLKENNPRK